MTSILYTYHDVTNFSAIGDINKTINIGCIFDNLDLEKLSIHNIELNGCIKNCDKTTIVQTCKKRGTYFYNELKICKNNNITLKLYKTGRFVFTCHNLLNCENIIEKCSQTLDYILKN
jgi:hypothetical protein